ncbi:MAG: adenylate/guanylate cyclase domain-containing protein [Acidimicrobiales bacterium]
MAAQTSAPPRRVVFLFTDIESSTHLWNLDQSGMRWSLHAHDEIVTDSVVSHNGRIINHLGDGLAAVFETTSDAAEAAVQAQARLGETDWPLPDGLRVRMGLHVGEVAAVPDDYFGPTISKAARVMSAANGGQIVCSSAAAAELERQAASYSISAEFRGVFELKGIGSERLYSIRSHMFPEDKTALRARPSDLGIRAHSWSSFIGRSVELTSLARLVRPGHLVTIIGFGGLGKSRLASEYLLRHSIEYDGSYWIDLIGIDTAADLASSLSNTIGVSPRPGMSSVQSLATYIDGAGSLLVLDGCEAAIDAVRELLAVFYELQEPPAVLATSRMALQTPTETTWRLGPLRRSEDMVQLFRDRVGARSPNMTFRSSDQYAISQLCRRLDGVPLALEIAAARVASLGLGEIEQKAVIDYTVDRSGAEPQLWSAIDWSYRQLDAGTARTFVALSVFGGSFTYSAAEAIVSDSQRTQLTSQLSRLADLSLLEVDRVGDESRLRMLGVLRDFAAVHPDPSVQKNARTRHRAYFRRLSIALGQVVSSSEEVQGWNAFRLSWSDIRLAFQSGLADGDVTSSAQIIRSLFYYSGYSLDQAVPDWALTLVDMSAFADHELFSSVAGTAAFGLFGRSELESAYDLARRGIRADATDPDGFCYLTSIIAAMNLGRLADAEELLAGWFELEDDQTTHARMWARAWRTLWHLRTGTPEAGASDAQVMTQLAAEVGSTSASAAACWILGLSFAKTDPQAALEALNQGAGLVAELSPRHLMAQLILGARTDVALQMEDTQVATKHCIEALESAMQTDWLVSAGHLLGSAALLLIRTRLPTDCELAAKLLGSMEASGQPARARARYSIDDALGRDAQPLMMVGSQLSLTEAAELALRRLRALSAEPRRSSDGDGD